MYREQGKIRWVVETMMLGFSCCRLLPGSLPNVKHAKTLVAREVPRVIVTNNIQLNRMVGFVRKNKIQDLRSRE